MSDLISIIIPVYNLESYINTCVKSLQNQTYSNIEILLIDDGSSDSSGSICDTLSEQDKRIRVIHQKNAGVSAARNTGLKEMKGDFVTFVDGDDYVSPEFIEVMYNAIIKNNADISTCGHYRVSFDGKLSRIYNIAENDEDVILLSGKDSIKNMFYGQICSASSGSKLYKKAFFEKLEFPDYVMGEDTFVVYHTFRNATLIAHTNKPLYYYVQHDSSVTNKKSNYFKFYDYVRLYDHILISDPYLNDKEYFLSFVNRLIENNLWVYMKLRNCPDMYNTEKKHIEDNIRKYRKYVISNPRSEKRVQLACLLTYGGMSAMNFVYDNLNK